MMGACFCSGPRPGHDLCPCRERHESGDQRELRRLRAEVERLKRQQSPAERRRAQLEHDSRRRQEIQDAGGIDCTMRPSDAIRP